MVSFLQTAKAVHALEPSTHWIHEATLAERLRISTDDLEGWTKCVREGGSGAVPTIHSRPTLNPTMSKSIFWIYPLITLSISTSSQQMLHHSQDRRSYCLVSSCQILLHWYVGELSVYFVDEWDRDSTIRCGGTQGAFKESLQVHWCLIL